MSGLHKPDGLSALLPSQSAAFLAPLDVRVLPGVGAAATGRLYDAGVRTIGDVAALPTTWLHQILSSKATGGGRVAVPVSLKKRAWGGGGSIFKDNPPRPCASGRVDGIS